MTLSKSVGKYATYLLLFFISALKRTKATVSQCMVATDFLLSQDSGELKIGRDILWQEFNRNCEKNDGCPVVMDEIFTTTTLDFNQMRSTSEYQEVIDACEATGTEEFPSSICTVSSELLLMNVQDDKNGEAVDDFYVNNEPVCFPFQCTQHQVALFHNAPLGCEPDKQTCMVYNLNYGDCGQRKEGAGVGNCVLYSKEIAKDEVLEEKFASLRAAAGLECVNSKLSGGKGPTCQIEAKPVKVTSGVNFKASEDENYYKNFVHACNNAGGDLCQMSATNRMRGKTGFINLDLIGDFNDYPICLPKSCSRAEKEVVTTQRIGDMVIHQINKIVESHARRKLFPGPMDWNIEDFAFRRLQSDSDSTSTSHDYKCPLANLEVCEFLVTDFHCANSQKSVTSPSSSASTMFLGRFLIVALTIASGMLI